ncbi:DUF86 domain-containing protein [Alicyclobacillus cycloheptanicus]|uniref:Uncharacterized protein YutE (UPF0331/DUF86 family) n=1 Tax=Alicyclobacillus cycloheptanicus TaxID=1457 RepID=A0ABT9XFD9_9BACL|nr:HepT-like ribonuclease domain-containing protein [Alicyclobacillus cycloheptanicus]MDQ0189007.1 uncharacterized protein YutE (UPF0331/DUF86 family) [Alicyclobacillus cycloheptanicus]WDM01652.1 DUF86 domain-containing protein [Alicyclobacillus cycloheptanicus]
MFITNQLRQEVDKYLRTIDQRADWLQTARAWTDDEWDETRMWAAERALHVAVECVTDAANLVIDALVMREPGGYADIVRVIMEEGVVGKAWFEEFEGILAFRNRLARGYTDLSMADVVSAVRTYGGLFRPFTASMRSYLDISST